MADQARTHSTADVRFLKTAVGMRLITPADAKRCLSLIAEGTGDAAAVAQQSGLISSEDCGRVAQRVAGKAKARTAKRSRPESKSKGQGSERPRRPLPLVLAGVAVFGVTALVGLSIAFAFDDPAAEVAVLTETPTATETAMATPATEASPQPAATKKAPKDRFRARTLNLVRKLHKEGKTRAALDILADMPQPNGEARALIKELEAALARPVEAPKAKAKPAQQKPAPVVEEQEDDYDFDDDSDAVDWPDDAEAAAGAPRPRAVAKPTPSVSDGEGDEVDTGFEDEDQAEDETTTGFEDEDEDEGGLGIDTNSPVAMAVGELLCVPHTLRKNAELSVLYHLQEGSELEDFESVGFDKFEVGTAYRSAGSYSEPVLGLEIGAGSQRLGRMWHAVRLQDQFEVDMRLWVNAGDSRSRLVFLFGKKLGVSWGQQIVKVSRSGGTKRLSGSIDRNAFRGERFVRVKMSLRDNLFSVYFDGRKTAERKLKPKDLKGRFGILAKGVRFQVTEIKIDGIVDTSAL